jgi:hypothetical protein
MIPVRLNLDDLVLLLSRFPFLHPLSGMNAPTFDAHPSVCPICHHSSLMPSHKLLPGLLVCEHCRERVVVSRSGHFVRDPFRFRQAKLERSLRRESHPVNRILRDLKTTRPNVWCVLLAGTLLFGGAVLSSDKLRSVLPQPVQSDPMDVQ